MGVRRSGLHEYRAERLRERTDAVSADAGVANPANRPQAARAFAKAALWRRTTFLILITFTPFAIAALVLVETLRHALLAGHTGTVRRDSDPGHSGSTGEPRRMTGEH